MRHGYLNLAGHGINAQAVLYVGGNFYGLTGTAAAGAVGNACYTIW